MKVKGKHILRADVATIWPMLQDEEVLEKISPGVSRIEKVGVDQYKAISDISIGPVRGSFEGDLSLIDKVDHETMALALSQKSKIGNAEAKIVMKLEAISDNETEVAYDGTAKISGRLATMGQRILGGVVTTLSKQVFKELEKIIDERNAQSVKNTTEDPLSNIKDDHTSESSETKKSFFQVIIEKIKSIWK